MRSKTKLVAIAAAAVAISGGMLSSRAEAGKPTITAGAGSSVTCDFTAKASFLSGTTPTALKNDWAQSAHQSDPGFNSKTNTSGDPKVTAAVGAVPDQQFSVNGPITTNSKGKTVTGSCTGTVTDGTNTAAITSATIVSTATSTTSNPATCAGLADTSNAGAYNTTVTWKSTTATITPTSGTASIAALLDPDGSVGFELTSSGAQITGSFAGGNADTKAYLDAKTGPTILAGITGPTVDSSNASSIKTLNPCEPGLKVKIVKDPAPDTAAIKAGKGIKKIGIGASGANLLGPPNGKPSTISFSA
jgi:hypothetical protein